MESPFRKQKQFEIDSKWDFALIWAGQKKSGGDDGDRLGDDEDHLSDDGDHLSDDGDDLSDDGDHLGDDGDGRASMSEHVTRGVDCG